MFKSSGTKAERASTGFGGREAAPSILSVDLKITGDVVCELPMYTRNYVQEGGGIQLGKSEKKDRATEASR